MVTTKRKMRNAQWAQGPGAEVVLRVGLNKCKSTYPHTECLLFIEGEIAEET